MRKAYARGIRSCESSEPGERRSYSVGLGGNHSRRTGSRGNACGFRLGWDLQLSDPSWGRASLLSKLCPVRQSDRVRSRGNSRLVLRLPVGRTEGLPIGAQLVAPMFEDAGMLSVAATLEAVLDPTAEAR